VAWLEAALDGRVRATVPDLVYGEIANALLRYVRAGQLAAADADEAMQLILEVPLRVVSLRSLAADALTLAREIELSVYDATYACSLRRPEQPSSRPTAGSQAPSAASR
jgi:predicted nucleic acid-binding protein